MFQPDVVSSSPSSSGSEDDDSAAEDVFDAFVAAAAAAASANVNDDAEGDPKEAALPELYLLEAFERAISKSVRSSQDTTGNV